MKDLNSRPFFRLSFYRDPKKQLANFLTTEMVGRLDKRIQIYNRNRHADCIPCFHSTVVVHSPCKRKVASSILAGS